MSDMYLVLRSRLEDVQSWTNLGVEAIRDAQRASGLSDERLARQIPVSTRTWIRWRERGQVPSHALDKVAAVLGLEVERQGPTRVQVQDDQPADRLAALEAEVAAMREELAEGLQDVRRSLDALAKLVAPARRARQAASSSRK